MTFHHPCMKLNTNAIDDMDRFLLFLVFGAILLIKFHKTIAILLQRHRHIDDIYTWL